MLSVLFNNNAANKTSQIDTQKPYDKKISRIFNRHVILSGTALTSSLLFFAVAGITPLQAGCSYLQALAYSNCTSTTGSTNISLS